jgi:hypothetical protein
VDVTAIVHSLVDIALKTLVGFSRRRSMVMIVGAALAYPVLQAESARTG